MRNDIQMRAIVQYLSVKGQKTLREILQNVRTNTLYTSWGFDDIQKDKYKPCRRLDFTVHQLSNHAARHKNMEKVPNTSPTEWRYVE